MNTALAICLIALVLVSLYICTIVIIKNNAKAEKYEIEEEYKKEINSLNEKQKEEINRLNKKPEETNEKIGFSNNFFSSKYSIAWDKGYELYPNEVTDENGWDKTIYKMDRIFVGTEASINIRMLKDGSAPRGPFVIIVYCKMTSIVNEQIVLFVEDPYGSYKFETSGLPIPLDEVGLLNQKFIIVSGEKKEGKIVVNRVRRTQRKKAG